MKKTRTKRRHLVLASIILIAISFGGLVAYVIEEQLTSPSVQMVELKAPITHAPTFLGSYPFILGYGNLLQNGTVYSYVWINASAIRSGDSFTAFPVLNVGLRGNGIDENNFTVQIIYFGSAFGLSPYWLNFSVLIPALHMTANSSQIGFSGPFSRSSYSILGSNGAEFFSQISNVVNSYNEFEYFFYIGNSTTPMPKLTHGPVY